MTLRSTSRAMLICSIALLCVGCKDLAGKPEAVALRPAQVLQFSVLYKENCAACHGENGKQGAAISLANPVYLAVAGVETIRKVIADGVPGSLMPGFAKSQGGMLTDQQVSVIAQGMESAWGNAKVLGGEAPPSYTSNLTGDPVAGEKAFLVYCSSCHGSYGTGLARGELHTGSLVDPSYLALISDQGLRSLIIAGQPQQGMPDWRSDKRGAGSRAMTDKEVSDVIAWLVSHRVAAPGQPYPHP